MSIDLKKGKKVNLFKCDPELKKFSIEISWSVKNNIENFNFDSAIFLLNFDKKVNSNRDLIYFANLKSDDQSIQFIEKCKDESNEIISEKVTISIKTISDDYVEIVIVANIYEALKRNQNLRMLENVLIRITNFESNQELANYKIKFNQHTTMDGTKLGSLIKRNNQWYFNADSKESMGGLKTFCDSYGVDY